MGKSWNVCVIYAVCAAGSFVYPLFIDGWGTISPCMGKVGPPGASTTVLNQGEVVKNIVF